MVLEINVLNINDHRPTFNPTNTQVSVAEDAVPGTSVAKLSLTDYDLSPYGTPRGWVRRTETNNAHEYFQLVHVYGVIWQLEVQSALDRDTMTTNPIVFRVLTVDLGSSYGSATVTVTITNVNDNRPTFSPSFYSWEVDYNATEQTSVGTVTATDGDIGKYNIPVPKLGAMVL